MKNLFEDASWRVKYACLMQIGSICRSAGKDNTKKLILPYYAKFMIDSENELKNGSAKYLREFVKYLDPDDIVNKIAPIIKTLVNDKNDFIRTSLASSVLSLAPVLGKKKTNEYILGFFLALLRDDCPEVRIAIFNSFYELTSVLPAPTLMQQILPVYLELGNDKNWKYRVQSLDILLIFEKELGAPFMNDKSIMKLIVDRLSDKVFTVRQKAIDTLKNLSKKLGSSWAEKHAIPVIEGFKKKNNFLYRMNYFFGIKALAPFLSHGQLNKCALKIAEHSKTEKVPNIKVAMLQTLDAIQKICNDKSVKDRIKTVYKSCSSESDSDVKYYAKLYLSKIKI